MKFVEITSATNPQFKLFKSLLTAKGIKENGLFILSGEKLIAEFLKNPPKGFQVEFVIFEDELKLQTSAKATKLSRELFHEVDLLGTHFNLLVIRFKEFQSADFNSTPQGLELICPLGDPRNLGSITRTALAFGAKTMILSSEAAHPFLPQSIKASAGAVLQIRFLKAGKKLSEIPIVAENFALELHGTQLHDTKWPRNLRLWVGEEGPGLQLSHEQKRQMKFVTIPTENVESLNASVSMSIAMWEWKKQITNT
jgi:RNA methyltransferase, TrmH family